MRMSCNGCRILRKGCSDDCIIKPCLDWITSPDAQANATLFLAKYYGRAGLVNLIEAGPHNLRPALFKSLLYEACGRIVDPVSGSVGLLCSGNWAKCQAAVDSVLNTGSPITGNNSCFRSSVSLSSVPAAAAASSSSFFPSYGVPALHQIVPPLKTYDIRHVAKTDVASGSDNTDKSRFKRSGTGSRNKSKTMVVEDSATATATEFSGMGSQQQRYSWVTRFGKAEQISREDESVLSVDTVESSVLNRYKPGQAWKNDNQNDSGDVGLELTLGVGPRN